MGTRTQTRRGADAPPAEVDGLDRLPATVGQVQTLWRLDPHAYSDSAEYREQVTLFVHRHLPHATALDAEVLTDDHGTRVLTSTSMCDPDGAYVGRHRVVALLDDHEVLP